VSKLTQFVRLVTAMLIGVRAGIELHKSIQASKSAAEQDDDTSPSFPPGSLGAQVTAQMREASEALRRAQAQWMGQSADEKARD
jgi:hypothetical protein